MYDEPVSSVQPATQEPAPVPSVQTTSIIVNPKTGEQFHIDPKDTSAFFDKGYQALDTYQSTIVNPKTGEQFLSHSDDIPEFEKKGYLTLAHFNNLQNTKNKETERLHKEGFFGYGPGALDVGIERLISPIAKPKVDKDATPEEQEAQKQAQEDYINEHEGAAYAGKIAGEVGTAATLLGPAGEAVSGVVRATGFTKAAIEGAVFSAPDVLQQAIEGKPQEAAESLAIGAGLGVAIHGLSFAGEKAAGKFLAGKEEMGQGQEELKGLYGKFDETKENLEKTKNEINDKEVHESTVSKAEEEHKAAKEALESHPLYQNYMNERRIAANTLGKAIGMSDTQIADLNKQLQDMPKILGIEPEDDALKIAKKISAKMDESGKNIGKAMKNLDDIIPDVARTTIIKEQGIVEADRRMGAILKDYIGPQREQAEKALKPFMDQMESIWNDPKPLTFSESTQPIKKWAREQVNFNKDNDFVNNIRKQASLIITQAFTEAEDAAIKTAYVPKLNLKLEATTADAIRVDRKIYSMTKLFDEIGSKVEAQDVLKPMFRGKLDELKKLSGHLSPYSLPGAAVFLMGGHGILLGSGILGGIVSGISHLHEKALLSQAIRTLKDSSKPGLDMAAEAERLVNEHIESKTSDFTKWLSSSNTTKVITTRSLINELLPNNGTGLSNDQKVDALRKQTTSLLTDPQFASQHAENHPIMNALQKAGMNNVAMGYQDHISRIAKVVQTILGNEGVKEIAPNPFASNNEAVISKATHLKINSALEIASDPTALLERVKNNTISKTDMAIAAATNPLTLNKMQMALVKEQAKGSKANLSFQQRLSLGILLGTNIDRATDPVSIQAIQATYIPFTPVVGSQGKGNLIESEKFASSFLTTSQRSSLDK